MTQSSRKGNKQDNMDPFWISETASAVILRAPALQSCVTSGKSLNLSGPQFLIYKVGKLIVPTRVVTRIK